jgi:hypothetical protein
MKLIVELLNFIPEFVHLIFAFFPFLNGLSDLFIHAQNLVISIPKLLFQMGEILG